MAKKHKKNLRAEKAKVQLKGAKLAKGLNVTKADFKVRKIILKTQLKDTGFAKKHNIKESITRLKHNNSSIKIETLKQIKEILDAYPEDIFPKYFGDLIQVCAGLCLELERDVRRESFRVLAVAFSQVSEAMVEPFFHILSSYLRCAMTHLNHIIQEDSLLLLDIMLEHTPSLVAKYHEKIFENFLDLISKIRNEAQPGRTLVVNVGKKTTNVMWRCQVLQRLLAILRAMNMRGEARETEPRVEFLRDHRFADDQEPVYIDLRRNFIEHNNSLSFLFKTNYNAGATGEASVQSCVELIMPLLTESWMEIRPEEERSGKVMIDKEAAGTLNLILAIIRELWNMVVAYDASLGQDLLQAWFRTSFTQKFTNLFVVDFPHSFQRTDRNDQVNSIALNLGIAYLFAQFSTSLKTEADIDQCNGILDYIQKCVRQKWKLLDQTASALLIENIRCIVLDRLPDWRRSAKGTILKQVTDIVGTVLTVLPNLSSRDARQNTSVILCEAVLRDDIYSLLKAALQNWILSLPDTLLQPEINVQLMRTLLKLGTHGNVLFLNGIRDRLDKIKENIKTIRIVGVTDQDHGKRQLEDILYWVDRK